TRRHSRSVAEGAGGVVPDRYAAAFGTVFLHVRALCVREQPVRTARAGARSGAFGTSPHRAPRGARPAPLARRRARPGSGRHAAPDQPGADAAQLKIARALLDRGEWFAARGAAAELQSRWPRSPLAPAAALLAASTFNLSGRHAEAIAAYRKVAQQYSGTRQEAEARFETGNCLVELGDDAHAVQEFTQALGKHDSPEVVQFAMERAQRRLAMGKTVDPKNVAAVFDHF